MILCLSSNSKLVFATMNFVVSKDFLKIAVIRLSTSLVFLSEIFSSPPKVKYRSGSVVQCGFLPHTETALGTGILWKVFFFFYRLDVSSCSELKSI